ncbi:universal stress protein [Flaviflexus sp.]|uniref:universal stress protein n=1 Tax=Flaviflexus sp. TaxID=1969482 RepID=UPI003F8D9175
MPHDRPIIVGTDGSIRARYAVLEAARIADRYGKHLRIMSAYSPLFAILAYDPEPPKEEKERIEKILVDSKDAVLQKFPDLDVETEWVLGESAPSLIKASAYADLIVVGARGQGAVHRMLVGSVATKVAANAHCSTFVVRDAEYDMDGPITVGVGPEANSFRAVKAAFRYARAAGTSVRGLRAHQHSAAGLANIPDGPRKDWLQGEIDKSVELSKKGFDEVAAKFPDVESEFVHIQAHATDSLIDAAGISRLIVVAPNGNGGDDKSLGSVALAVLHHAPAVLIAR